MGLQPDLELLVLRHAQTSTVPTHKSYPVFRAYAGGNLSGFGFRGFRDYLKAGRCAPPASVDSAAMHGCSVLCTYKERLLHPSEKALQTWLAEGSPCLFATIWPRSVLLHGSCEDARCAEPHNLHVCGRRGVRDAKSAIMLPTLGLRTEAASC